MKKFNLCVKLEHRFYTEFINKHQHGRYDKMHKT